MNVYYNISAIQLCVRSIHSVRFEKFQVLIRSSSWVYDNAYNTPRYAVCVSPPYVTYTITSSKKKQKYSYFVTVRRWPNHISCNWKS